MAGAHAAPAGGADDVRPEGVDLARGAAAGPEDARRGATSRPSSAAPPARSRRSATAGSSCRAAFARELGLPEPDAALAHAPAADRLRSARCSGSPPACCEKIALDVELLAQTEVGEVREPRDGRLLDDAAQAEPGRLDARARLRDAGARGGGAAAGGARRRSTSAAPAAGTRSGSALSDALACTGGAARVDARDARRARGRRGADAREHACRRCCRRRSGSAGAERPEDYLGAAGALVDGALAAYRERTR